MDILFAYMQFVNIRMQYKLQHLYIVLTLGLSQLAAPACMAESKRDRVSNQAAV